jgi:hypothetical protein
MLNQHVICVSIRRRLLRWWWWLLQQPTVVLVVGVGFLMSHFRIFFFRFSNIYLYGVLFYIFNDFLLKIFFGILNLNYSDNDKKN